MNDTKRDFKWYFLRWLCCVADLVLGLIGTLTLGFIELSEMALYVYGMFLDHETLLNTRDKMED